MNITGISKLIFSHCLNVDILITDISDYRSLYRYVCHNVAQ